MPPVIRVVGPSGAGKTTLIERLVPELAARGLRVGTIKHASHGFEGDKPGSDSARHTAAGGEPAMVIDRQHTMIMTSGVTRSDDCPTPLAAIVARWFSDADVVLAEGFSTEPQPAIVVQRGDLEPRSPGEDSVVLCAVTDRRLGYAIELDPHDTATVTLVADQVALHAKENADAGVSLVVGTEAIEVSAHDASTLSSAVRTMLGSLGAIPADSPRIELHIRTGC